MNTTKLKLYPCRCGGEMKIKKVAQNGGMDGTYWNWELTCNKCGLTKTYAADGFYGREYKTYEEVIDDWNSNKKKDEHQSEIIRCKDCKNLIRWRSEEEEKEFGQLYLCGINIFNRIEPEDFCSRAVQEGKRNEHFN